MTIQKPIPFFLRRASGLVATRFSSTAHRRLLPLLLGGILSLVPGARAQMINNVTVGPVGAPYSYNLTVEFANGHYYDFTLRSAAATLAGDTLINTIASYPAANMTVDQQFFGGLGYYVNGITVGNDAASGYDSVTGRFWAYWNGTAATPVQWTSPQDYGESGRTLTPGQADGWVYSTGSNPPQATNFAVPEPGTWTLLFVGGAGLLLTVRGGRKNRAVAPQRDPSRPEVAIHLRTT